MLAYFQASQLAEFATTRTTYDELKSAGKLGLVRNLAPRERLGRYYTLADNPSLSERPVYRERIRGIIPLDVQRYIWAECYQLTPDSRQALVSCDAPIDDARAAEILARISTDQGLMDNLRYWVSTMDIARIIASNRSVIVTDLRDAVLAEMTRESNVARR